MGVKALAKGSRVTVVAFYLQKDLRARLAQRRGVASHRVETGGGGQTVDETVAFTRHAFSSMLRHGQFPASELAGKRLLEVGPGDSLGVGLLALGHGAREVVGLDRFAVARDEARVTAIHEALLGVTSDQALSRVEGIGIEDAVDYFGAGSFDVIYSLAVLEHVADLDGALAAMHRLLCPGGVMMHAIGGGDHGMFTDGGHHPLTYMTIPTWLYALMTAHSGGPNRVLPVMIRRALERSNWDWRLTIGDVLAAPTLEPYRDRLDVREFAEQVAIVEQVRPRLREPFRSLPASELMVTGTFLHAKKLPALPAPQNDGQSLDI